MRLEIDGFFYGECRRYFQADNAWNFEMERGLTIVVPFDRIKLFTSSGELDIIMAF